MKIVVIGGTGRIGNKLVSRLRAGGHDVLPASRRTGVNTVTGEGLAKALAGARAVVDVSDAPSFQGEEPVAFFETSNRNLLAAEAAANVTHHVALSVVGSDRLPEKGYRLAKLTQERLIRQSNRPYTILRATQFYEFVGLIAEASAEGQAIRLPQALFQPIAADDVAAALAEIAVSTPINGTIEIAGPQRLSFGEAVQKLLIAKGDARKVISDPQGRYLGAEVDDESLTPGADYRRGAERFDDWLRRSIPTPAPAFEST